MTAAAHRYTPNDAVIPAYLAHYQLYGEINRAMTPMWERIANPQVLQ